MAYLALADFIDVVSKSGTPKATKVKEIKHRDEYSPAIDYYKALREGIVDTHENGKSKTSLQAIVLGATSKKAENYKAAVDGYSKWWGVKTINWFKPPTGSYTNGSFEIGVNPELGLEFGGQRFVIKLYLKAEALTKLRTDLITALMGHTLMAPAGAPVIMSVLDVRRSKLISASVSPTTHMLIVDAELAYIAALWPSV